MVTVTRIIDSKTEDLQALRSRIRAEYEGFRARKLALDMTRGKPSPEQLDLANALLSLPGERDFFSQAKEDVRNYGGLQGLAEARALFAPMLGVQSFYDCLGAIPLW